MAIVSGIPCLPVFFITTLCLLSPHCHTFLPSSLHPHFIFCPWLILFFFFFAPHPIVFQVRTMASAGGPDNLVMLDPAKYKARPRVPEPAGDGSSTQPKWQVGEQEYEALMRMLDNLVSIKTSAWMNLLSFPSN